VIKRERFGARLHPQHFEQQLAAAAVSPHSRPVVTELSVTRDRTTVKLFHQAIYLDSSLVYGRGLPPQTATLITSRKITDGPNKSLAQDLAYFHCPRFFRLLR
jgi:hypothetical protein